MKWEYMSIIYYYAADDNFTDEQASTRFLIIGNYNFLMETLNECGLQGWEMVNHIVLADSDDDRDSREFYLKRIIKQPC